MKIKIQIKRKGGFNSPLEDKSKIQKNSEKVINILPIVMAKNKDFLKIILKKYPDYVKNWVLKTYPRPKVKLSEPCKICKIRQQD